MNTQMTFFKDSLSSLSDLNSFLCWLIAKKRSCLRLSFLVLPTKSSTSLIPLSAGSLTTVHPLTNSSNSLYPDTRDQSLTWIFSQIIASGPSSNRLKMVQDFAPTSLLKPIICPPSISDRKVSPVILPITKRKEGSKDDGRIQWNLLYQLFFSLVTS